MLTIDLTIGFMTQVTLSITSPSPPHIPKALTSWESTKEKIKAWLPSCAFGAVGVGAIIGAVVVVGGLSAIAPWLPVALAVAFVALVVIAKYAPGLITRKPQEHPSEALPAATSAIPASPQAVPCTTIDMPPPITSKSEVTIDNFQKIIEKKLLTEPECQSLLNYWTENKDNLIKEAKNQNKCIRIKARSSFFGRTLIRTLLVTPEGKCFIILNRTNSKKDKTVGTGSTKLVKYCFEVTEQKLCTHATFQNEKEFKRETLLFNKLKDTPNTLQLLATDIYTSKNGRTKYSMITEYCDQGDLWSILKRSELPENEKKEFCTNIATALKKVHEQGYIHRDIKPDNIFVKKEDGKLIPILADFGLACEITDTNQQGFDTGAPRYAHPRIFQLLMDWHNKALDNSGQEALRSQLPPLQSRDVWSLGAVFYEILKQDGKGLPWQGYIDLKPGQPRRAIVDYFNDNPDATFDEPSDKTSLDYLAWKMLQVDPANQFTLDEVIHFLEAHP